MANERGKKPTRYTQHRFVKYLAKHSIMHEEFKERFKLSDQCFRKWMSFPENIPIGKIQIMSHCYGFNFGEACGVCAGVKNGTVNHWYDE